MLSPADRVAQEFAGARLGNRLRVLRAQATAMQLVATAGNSLPRTLRAPGALQGAYRLMRTPAVLPEDLLDPHFVATAQRARCEPVTLCLHDTTEARFGGRVARRGLGVLPEGGQGFFAHFSLAVSPDGRPLGALHLYAWQRPAPAPGAKLPKKKLAPSQKNYLEDKESLRWLEGVEAAEARTQAPSLLVHVMDREGDAFESLAALLERGSRFIIRACHDRRLDASRKLPAERVDKLFDSLAARPVVCEREVSFGPRAPHSDQPRRSARTATLEVRGGSFVLSPASGAVSHVPQRMAVNVVEVRERNAPEGEEPIVWRLLTTEPVGTEAELLRVVDWYRRRWTIEEFFKVLKTGCSYESLQLESAHALLNALALLIPVAWVLLDLRWMERARPEAPADTILTPLQAELLRRSQPPPKRSRPSPERTTPFAVGQALRALAALGGHLPHNGPPGWQTLLHGYRELLAMERAILLMAPQYALKPDQS